MAAACAAATKRMATKDLEMNMESLVGFQRSTGRLMSSKEICPRFYICSLISCEHGKSGVGSAPYDAVGLSSRGSKWGSCACSPRPSSRFVLLVPSG